MLDPHAQVLSSAHPAIMFDVESQSSGPVFYIEKCFTATVNIEGEEPTFDAEQILPAEFEALVVIAQKAEAAKDADSAVLEHTSGTPTEQPEPPKKEASTESKTEKTEKKPKAKVPDLSHLDFKSAIEVLERTPMDDIHGYARELSRVVSRQYKQDMGRFKGKRSKR